METKQCNSCNIIKTIINFSIKRSNTDGYNNICKSCKKVKDLIYKRSTDGILTKAYGKHKSIEKKNNYTLDYSKQELREWLDNQKDFISIYEQWKHNNYNTNDYPSITKIDNTKPYTIDNIKLRRWGDIKDTNTLKPKHIRDKQKNITKRNNRLSKGYKKVIKIRHKHMEMKSDIKECYRCKIVKNKTEFYKSNICKQCNKESQIKRNRTKRGTAYRIYKKQLQKSKQRGHDKPMYTFEELYEWLMNKDIFHVIFKEWEESGYKTLKCVSCDRIDRHKGYTFDNITVTTWEKNRDRWFKYRE